MRPMHTSSRALPMPALQLALVLALAPLAGAQSGPAGTGTRGGLAAFPLDVSNRAGAQGSWEYTLRPGELAPLYAQWKKSAPAAR